MNTQLLPDNIVKESIMNLEEIVKMETTKRSHLIEGLANETITDIKQWSINWETEEIDLSID